MIDPHHHQRLLIERISMTNKLRIILIETKKPDTYSDDLWHYKSCSKKVHIYCLVELFFCNRYLRNLFTSSSSKSSVYAK